METKSVYIHIPFCKTICSYCDFCKIYYNKEWVNKYLQSLKKEIIQNYKNEDIETIYIGGGTPNSLAISELTNLLEIVSLFKTNQLEYTIECNIELITEEQLILFKKYGINRISIGMQTANQKYLKYLNRDYTKKNIMEKIFLVKKYFNNINVDLIYAIQNQTLKELDEDINFILSLDIPHISTYSLIIEENTLLKINNVKPIDEELDYEMYKLIIKKLNKYIHYEISNFSKKGFESKHNLTYWNNQNYYGFGLGASGYIKNTRYNNTKSLNNYLNNKYLLNKEVIHDKIKEEYELILGFRKIKGISIEEYNKKYNTSLLEKDKIKKLLDEKKLIIKNGFIKLNEKYIYISNEILVELI